MQTATRELKMFSDEYEWFAAYDYEDLKAVIREHWGEDYNPKNYCDEPIQDVFELCDPAKVSKVWLDADGKIAEHNSGTLTAKTNAEWLASLGRGFLWTTEG
jgi:hypothetical protein